jgi:uncharacterized protein
VDVNAVDEQGVCPTLHACREGHTEAVELLLSRGAALEARDGQGRTGLAIATLQHHRALVQARGKIPVDISSDG